MNTYVQTSTGHVKIWKTSYLSVMLSIHSPVQAALAPFESGERLTLVAAFAISMYNTIKRVQKPFKNLQQSTYELVYPEKGIRAIGEKVNRPPL